MRARLVITIILSVSVLAAACGGTDDDAAGEPSTEPIRIGLLDEQSGPTAAVQGKAGAGARAAVEAINAEGGIDGRPVQLVTRDTEGDASATLRAISELATEGVVAIVGPVNGALCQAVPTALARVELPGICLSPADLPEDDRFLFGIGVSLAQVDEVSFDHLAAVNGHVGVVAQKTALGELIDAHIAAYHDESVEFTVERVEPTDTTAKAQIQKLMAAGVGGIMIGPCGPLALTAAKEAVDLGFTGQIVLYNCLASDSAAQAVKGFANGNIVTFASQFGLNEVPEGDPQHAAFEAFIASGAEREAVTVTGWDGMYLLKGAIEQAGSTDADAIIEALEGGFEYAGAWSMGHITADDHRGVTPENALIPVRFTSEGTMERLPQG